MPSPFLTAIAAHMRTLHYRENTIKTYLYWIKYFIIFNDKQHPLKLGNEQVETFLTYLANQRAVTPKTQSVALNALTFLYNKFLQEPLSLSLNFKHSAVQPKLPTVLNSSEIALLFSHLNHPYLLVAQLLYGSGLRNERILAATCPISCLSQLSKVIIGF